MKKLYIANWKMNMSYGKSLDFCHMYKNQIIALAQNATIILCPSFLALAPITEIFKNTAISIGAQNCSEYEAGSYTGEVSSQSLAEIGIRYCIVGHSERRILFGETTNAITKKTNLLFQHNIMPIICIGETKDQFENKGTCTVLNEQLKPILESIPTNTQSIIIAYEPVWSIGTGIVPEITYLEEVFSWITKIAHHYAPHCRVQLLYGGSVNEKNSTQLKNIPHINGFLIGGASTDFEKFSLIIQ